MGRICLIIYGTHYRKLVCIVDFIDRNRVLVDGGKGKLSNIKRISLPLRWFQVTKMSQESDVINEYKKSSMGRRNTCIQKKQDLNDFGRFKLYYIKGQFKKKSICRINQIES